MDGTVNAIACDAYGNLYAGGSFTTAGGATANRIAKWDGSTWNALGTGMNSDVKTLVFDSYENLYAGGDFTTAGEVTANRIAKWDGSTWNALGTGMNTTVRALAFDSSGTLYVGGDFATAGGKDSAYLAKCLLGGSYSIGGRITKQSDSSNLPGVNLSFSQIGNTSTATNGTYSVAGIRNGAYIVTPSLSGYTFVPANRTITINNANQSGIDFVGRTEQYTLTYNAGTGGTLTGTSPQTVNSGANGTAVTATASTGYHFTGWSDGVATASRTDTNVTANVTVTANFAINQYTLTYNAGTGGTLTGTSPQMVNHGANGTLVTAAASTGYHFTGWSDGVATTSRTDTNITASKTVTANFAHDTGMLTMASGGNGTTTPVIGSRTINTNTATSISATASTGYHFTNWTFTGSVSVANVNSPSTTATLTGAQGCTGTVTANFAHDTGTLTMASGGNGTTTPAIGSSTINTNTATSISVTANPGYHFTSWTFTGSVSVANVNSASTTATLTGAHGCSGTVTANFAHETGTLTMASGGNGTTTPVIGTSTINTQTATSVSATPNTDYHFTNWEVSGSVTVADANSSPTTATLTGAHGCAGTVTANFARNTATLTISPTSMGTATFSDGSTAKTINTQTFTTIKAIPGTDWRFDKWVVLPGGPVTITKVGTNWTARLTGAHGEDGFIEARFLHNQTGLTMATVGSGTVTPPTGLQDTVTPIPIKAVPADGYHFMNWTKTDSVTIDNADAAETSATLTGAATVTANFAINSYSVVFNAGTNGSITGTNSQTINHGANCSKVTPAPATNYHFTGWTGDYEGPDNPLTLPKITKNMEITANFAHNTATLTVNANGNGNAEASVENPVNTVTTIPISATPDANNHFVNWTLTSGSATIANANSVAATVTFSGGHGSTATVTANFAVDTIAPTAAPVISATDGTYEDRVVVTWKAVPGATSYKIYRNNLNSTTGIGDPIGETTDCIFEDNTAVYGNTYYYFAKATNSVGDSVKFSAGNSGYVAKVPAVPGAITASDGTYFNKIRVSWAKVTGATLYRVFRTETDTPAPDPAQDTNLIGETTALFLNDFGDKIAPPPEDVARKYYYWIAAKNANAATAISKFNTGYLSKKGPATVTASNGTYSGKIVVTWTSVLGATAYDVYRYTDSAFKLNETKVGDKVAFTEFRDASGAGTYYYKVKAKYGSGNPVVYRYDSDFSSKGAAGKASGSFAPTDTAYVSSVENIANLIKSSAYYSMDVPVGTTRMVATLGGTNSLTPKNDCDLYAKFANFPTTASYNAKGVENKVNEILTVTNPTAGPWYFLLYGYTAYSGVTLTINCYSVTDIVLTQVPVNDLAVPFTAVFKGQVVDEIETGIPNIVVQTRNPITGLTSSLTKTDAKGIFSYSALISTEGEHTFDFFFNSMPANGTASHTVATRKGCFEDNNFFDFSAYLPATPVEMDDVVDIVGLQAFLDIRTGWDIMGTVDFGDTYETLWINSTLVKAENDAQLLGKLDEGLYMFFYGVEGAGVGNDTTITSALSAVPFVVHVETSKKGDVLTALKSAGIIDGTQELAINGGRIGIIAVASLSSPDEATDGYNISLLAREQLEILAVLAGWANGTTGVTGVKYSDVLAKQVTLTLANGRTINIVAVGFVK